MIKSRRNKAVKFLRRAKRSALKTENRMIYVWAEHCQKVRTQLPTGNKFIRVRRCACCDLSKVRKEATHFILEFNRNMIYSL